MVNDGPPQPLVFPHPIETNPEPNIISDHIPQVDHNNLEQIPVIIPEAGSNVETFPVGDVKPLVVVFDDDNDKLIENRRALKELGIRVDRNARIGKFISFEEAQIIDSWAEEYGISQHHKAEIGSGKHYTMGWDHTHLGNLHVPFKK